MLSPGAVVAQTAKKVTGRVNPKTSTAMVKAQKAPRQNGIKLKGDLPLGLTRQSNVLSSGLRQSANGRTLRMKGKKAPVKFAEGASAPTIYGSVIYNDLFEDEGLDAGMYSFAGAVGERLYSGPNAQSGGILVENVYYAINYYSLWDFLFIDIEAYDFESGEKLGTADGEVDNIFRGLVTDPTSGIIYGVGFNADGDGFQLSTVEFNSDYTINVNPIADLDLSPNSLVCDKEGQLYVISGTFQGETAVGSTLYKLDKTDGSVTVVGETGMAPQYLSSATVDQKSGRMFWNVNTPDELSYMCEVNMETGEATVLYQLEYGDEIMGMVIPAPAAEDGAPAEVSDLAANFVDGSLSGTISFTAPETLFDGTVGTGALTYEVLGNGVSLATGSTEFGAPVTADVTVPSPGICNFVVTVANEVGKSPKAKLSVFVGNGVPAAPAEATLSYDDAGVMSLTWSPVTTSVDGGYVNPAEVTYTVKRYPEGTEIATGLKETSLEESVNPEEISKIWYTVAATFDGATGPAVQSNVISLVSFTPPYINSLGTEGALDDFVIIDANGDGKVWTVNVSSGAARMDYNASQAMDDWMISPALVLEAGKKYSFSIEARANGNSYPERIEVKMGQAASVAGMTETIVEPTELVGTTYSKVGDIIEVAESGKYYIGIHGISDADMYYLYVKDFTVVSAEIPVAVSDLAAVANAEGEYNANISFNAPSVNLLGEAVSALTAVEVKRNDEVVKTFDAPQAGAALSFEDEVEQAGTYTYTVQAFNEAGAGETASVSVYIGVARPAVPENITITEEGNTGKVTLTWDAVTTDFEGNPINVSKVSYLVCESTGSGWAPITDAMTETTYTLQAVPEGEQDFVQYAVFAQTEGGNNGAVSDMIAAGTPYDGMLESFENGELHYIWGTGYSENNGQWGIYTDEQFSDLTSVDGDNGFAAMNGQYVESTSGLFTGKINLEGAVNPGVSFFTYNIVGDNPDINQLQVYVKEASAQDWVELSDVIVIDDLNPGETGWQKVVVSLEGYAGKTIQVRFQATTKQYIYTMIDMIKVGSQLGNDLSVKSINAPAFVANGAEYNVNVVVLNNGTQAVSGANVNLYTADGDLLATKALDEMASGASVTVAFTQTMSAVATEPVGFYALVENGGDENFDDNTTETIYVAPKASNLPAVTDLAGECTEEGVVLTWSEPDLSSAPVESDVVDFEDANAWAMEYAGWTFVDVDESAVGGFQGINLPGIEPGTTTASFFVFDSAGDEFNQTFDAHSGDIYLAALFRYDDGTTDDWAISPALSGDAQTISFWAKSYSSDYPEKIEMYYSMNGTDVADFVQVGNTVNPVPADWTEYTFDVPAGAKYFAIRSCATGSFMLMLDDFTFAAAEGTSADLSIVGYDVYRDGVKINAETVEETSYVDATAEPNTEYTYQVVAIYDRGISGPSNVANILTTGINEVLGAVKVYGVKGAVEVAGAAGLNVSVVAADGKVMFNGVASDKETVNVPAGVYVVRAGNKTVKVAVK